MHHERTQHNVERLAGEGELLDHTDLVRDELSALAPHDAAPPVPLEIVIQYTVGTFMALLTWWAENDPPYTAAQMDASFQRLTMPGVLAGLGLAEAGGDA